MTSREVLYEWFITGKKPPQNQFYEIFDSFFHKGEDEIGINKVTGLQEALDSLSSNTQDIVPIQLASGQTGSITVADITVHNSIRLMYTIIRGDLTEMGEMLLDNRANDIVSVVSDMDDCGFTFTKSISGNNLQISWSDALANGVNGLLYIVEIKRTLIPV